MASILLISSVNEVLAGLLATMAIDASLPRDPVSPSCTRSATTIAMMMRPAASSQTMLTQPSRVGQTVQRAADGLFYIEARINGAPVRFLVDTGATMIVLTKADAARAGVLPHIAAFNDLASTAGGDTTMARVRLDRVAVAGSLDFDVPAAVAGDGLRVSLLGASWFTQIASLTIAGDRMVLQ